MYIIVFIIIIIFLLVISYVQKNPEKIKIAKEERNNIITNIIGDKIIDDIKIDILEKEYNYHLTKNAELKNQLVMDENKKLELEIEREKLKSEIELIRNLRLNKLRLFASKNSLIYSTILRSSIINEAVTG
ncbi:hypothetical protein [Carp edema virus]|nr:hypothetical protein [Carp edema virus]